MKEKKKELMHLKDVLFLLPTNQNQVWENFLIRKVKANFGETGIGVPDSLKLNSDNSVLDNYLVHSAFS